MRNDHVVFLIMRQEKISSITRNQAKARIVQCIIVCMVKKLGSLDNFRNNFNTVNQCIFMG